MKAAAGLAGSRRLPSVPSALRIVPAILDFATVWLGLDADRTRHGLKPMSKKGYPLAREVMITALLMPYLVILLEHLYGRLHAPVRSRPDDLRLSGIALLR
ncbi:hypothetical protein [Halomonas sp. B23F22_10]|uniref:hypothetical protein n=1 Tax=Halomonas sp. B23F22_10 TaxID=3459515 RepID=UPI00373EF913